MSNSSRINEKASRKRSIKQIVEVTLHKKQQQSTIKKSILFETNNNIKNNKKPFHETNSTPKHFLSILSYKENPSLFTYGNQKAQNKENYYNESKQYQTKVYTISDQNNKISSLNEIEQSHRQQYQQKQNYINANQNNQKDMQIYKQSQIESNTYGQQQHKQHQQQHKYHQLQQLHQTELTGQINHPPVQNSLSNHQQSADQTSLQHPKTTANPINAATFIFPTIQLLKQTLQQKLSQTSQLKHQIILLSTRLNECQSEIVSLSQSYNNIEKIIQLEAIIKEATEQCDNGKNIISELQEENSIKNNVISQLMEEINVLKQKINIYKNNNVSGKYYQIKQQFNQIIHSTTNTNTHTIHNNPTLSPHHYLSNQPQYPRQSTPIQQCFPLIPQPPRRSSISIYSLSSLYQQPNNNNHNLIYEINILKKKHETLQNILVSKKKQIINKDAIIKSFLNKYKQEKLNNVDNNINSNVNNKLDQQIIDNTFIYMEQQIRKRYQYS